LASGFRGHLAGASALLALAMWLSSGTMTPMASTFFAPLVSEPCHYLYSVDHPLHEAVFRMLDGQPRELWESSIKLRRILFPLVAYPFMKIGGYVAGGLAATILAHVAALVALGVHLRRRHGEDAALVGVWLLSTYPGITYWAGLPYGYVAIVPASIGLHILLVRLDERPGWRETAVTSAAMGVLMTAYDLLPFFGVAALLLLARRRRFAELPVALVGLVAPSGVVVLVLKLALHVDWTNRNTAIYSIVAGAYLHPPPLGEWLAAVSNILPVLAATFFYGHLVFLPVLFLACLLVTRRRLELAEGALLVAGAAVFFFNNLAPPYVARWQMRGFFIPRLYQPVFVALLVYGARVLGGWRDLPRPKARLLVGVALFAFVGNASIAFGPVARVPWAGYAYHRFYMHSEPGAMEHWLAVYGRRPLGFCGGGPSSPRQGLDAPANGGGPL
jgi:hypothetical protein